MSASTPAFIKTIGLLAGAGLRVALALGLLAALSPAQGGAALQAPAAGEAVHPAGRPVTVEDLLAFRRIIEPYAYQSIPEVFTFSPDGRRFLLGTRTVDPKRLTSEERIQVYEVSDVLEYLRKPGHAPLPEGRVLVRWVNTDNLNHYGIYLRLRMLHSFSWSADGRTLYFIGKTDDAPDQVYSVSVESGKLTQLTHARNPILAFQINEAARRLVATEWVNPAAGLAAEKIAIMAGLHQMMDLACIGCDRYGVRSGVPQLVVQELGSKAPPRVLVGPKQARIDRFQSFWMSPDGRKAVVAVYPPAEKNWDADYGRMLENSTNSPDPEDSRFAHLYVNFSMRPIHQYYFLDLESGDFHPILDAPTQPGTNGAIWSPDSRKVLLANTYLPVDEGPAEARALRRKWPFLAEYDVDSKTYRPVLALAGDSANPVDGQWPHILQVFGNDAIVISRVRADGGKVSPLVASWGGKDWTISETGAPAVPVPVELMVRESLATPPEVVARDPSSGVERPITHLNPQLRDLRLSPVSEIEWKDSKGYAWQGALILPDGYQPGRRYPLVIECRNYDRNRFVFGGQAGLTAPFAGRALAAKGIMVLQMPARSYQAPPFNMRDDFVSTQRGIEAAVAHLVARGDVDPARVGVTGWSYTGAPVQHAITFSQTPFAAAIIADAMGTGTVNYATLYGFIPPGMNYQEEMLGGARPWGERRDAWVENSPVYNLDRVHTPLLMHSYLPGGVVSWWDIYAILRRQGKPVELWQYIDSDHAPQKPGQRLHAQKMVVDWYAYWLKGERDPDPAKAAQYARWDELRQQHLADVQRSQSALGSASAANRTQQAGR